MYWSLVAAEYNLMPVLSQINTKLLPAAPPLAYDWYSPDNGNKTSVVSVPVILSVVVVKGILTPVLLVPPAEKVMTDTVAE